jgi:predicted transcriptional regulator
MDRTLTIKIESNTSKALEEMKQRVFSAWNTGEYQGEHRTYSTPSQLFKVFTPLRWDIINVLQSQSDWIGLRALARLLSRDPTALLRDLSALSEEGIVEKNDAGKWICPFSSIHADFTLEHAA